MAQEPEAVPQSTQEEFSKKSWEERETRLEELRQKGLAAVCELEVHAKDARTKKRFKAARRQLEDARTSESAL